MAEELGGGDYISLNLYLTARGARLRPCEMPAAKVVDFVLALAAMPDPADAGSTSNADPAPVAKRQ